MFDRAKIYHPEPMVEGPLWRKRLLRAAHDLAYGEFDAMGFGTCLLTLFFGDLLESFGASNVIATLPFSHLILEKLEERSRWLRHVHDDGAESFDGTDVGSIPDIVAELCEARLVVQVWVFGPSFRFVPPAMRQLIDCVQGWRSRDGHGMAVSSLLVTVEPLSGECAAMAAGEDIAVIDRSGIAKLLLRHTKCLHS